MAQFNQPRTPKPKIYSLGPWVGSLGSGSRNLVSKAAGTEMDKGLGCLPFDLVPPLAIKNVGDQKVMIACTLKSSGTAQKPATRLINGRGFRLAPPGVADSLKRGFGGFSKPAQKILPPIRQNTHGEIGARFQNRTKTTPFRQSDTEPGWIKRALLDPTGKHGLIGARFGISRRDHEKPAGNTAKGPPNGIQMFRPWGGFFLMVFHNGILVEGRKGPKETRETVQYSHEGQKNFLFPRQSEPKGQGVAQEIGLAVGFGIGSVLSSLVKCRLKPLGRQERFDSGKRGFR